MKRRSHILFIGALAAACGGEPESEPAEAVDEITGNGGNAGAVGTEDMRPNAGRYPAVMEADGCTGTVIGPHAVLTAYHCRATLANELRIDGPGNVVGMGSQRFIRWRNAPANNGDDVRMEITNTFGNPHAVNLKWYRSRGVPFPPHEAGEDNLEVRPYAPDWWGSTMLPHPHDLAVYFVPGLTEEFIRNNGIDVATIDGLAIERAIEDNPPLAFGNLSIPRLFVDYEIVGRMGDSNRRRRFGDIAFLGPNPASPGQLPFDAAAPGSVHTNPGDSGGPSYVYLSTWSEQTRSLAAATKSGFNSVPGGGARGNTVALAYQPGMSAQQRESVRLNHLWLSAQAADADDDGWPNECDNDPTSAGYDRITARCPYPDGRPTRTRLKGFPQGRLMCRDGFVATGHRGRHSNWGIRTMALQCTPRACVEGGDPGSCDQAYWTDRFGLHDRGTAYSETCDAGRGTYGFWGYLTTSNQRIQSLGIQCMRPNRAYGAHDDYGRTSRTGRTRFYHSCPSGRYVQGVTLRMMSRYHISGIQAVCTES